MKFSCAWLGEYVELPAAASELAALLTGVGLTVDSVEQQAGDQLLDVEVTSNRPDCMNHLGLAREVAAASQRPLIRPDLSIRPAVEAESCDYATVSISDPADCPRYVAVGVRGLKIGPSPTWLASRLRAVGVRPINNVVDVTNFVLWEYGQPLHAFDLDKLPGGRIVIRRGLSEERLTTLDGVERELDEDCLVIAGAEGAVALAGIMGGAETEVSEDTTRVLVESACFDPPLVRRAARRLGLATDASHRFERGSDPEICLEAALRAAELMADLGGGEVEAVVVDAQPAAIDTPHGRLESEKLDRFAGVEVPRELVETGLTALGFDLAAKSPGIWEVTVPSWRRLDFELDESGHVYPAYFYEEALRLFGFDRIPSTVPAVRGPDRGSSAGHLLREGLREYLSAAGLAETVTYPFHSADADKRFLAPETIGESLVLANALSELYEMMRRSLLPGLVEGARFNQRRRASSVRLFEIGHLFPGGERAEVEAVGVVMGGEFDRPWERRVELDLFDLKGIAEGLGARAGIGLEFRRADCRGFVPGTASEIFVGERAERVGFLGQVEGPDLVFPLFALQMEVSVLARAKPPRVDPPSRFPGVDVDLTLTHSLDLAWSEIDREIRSEPPTDLVDFGLKDRFEGAKVPAGAVNSTIFFRYVATDRSLTQEEVNERHLRIAVRLDERFGWRGGGS